MNQTPQHFTDRIVIGTPCYGGNISHHYVISALNLQLACLQRRVALSFKLLGNDAIITRARNLVVSQFLDEPLATHLLFIDADIGFTPDQVFALLDARKEVVGSPYPLKRLDWDRIKTQAQSGASNFKSAAFDYAVNFVQPLEMEGSLAKAHQIGTGFLMIQRGVFDRMAVHYPKLKFNSSYMGLNGELASPNTYAFFDTMIDPDTGAYISEDYAFCRRWIDAGGEIWANTAATLTHVGPVALEGSVQAALETLKR